MTRSRRRISASLRDLEEQEHTLYQFWNASDVLLYVGITVDWPKRLAQHAREKHWFPQVETIKTFRIPTRSQALANEAEMIRTLKPLYNDQHNEMVPVDDDATERLGMALTALDRIVYFANDEDEERYKAALVDATDALESARHDPDDELAGDPVAYAAEIAVDNLAGSERWLRKAARRVARILPAETVNEIAWRSCNESHLIPRFGTEEFGQQYTMLHYLAEVLAEAELAKLPSEESSEWRIAGARALGAEGYDGAIAVQAVEMRIQALQGRTHGGMCAGPGISIERCAQRAEHFVWIGNCLACEGTCRGHLAWCGRHWEDAKAGRMRNVRGERFAILGQRSYGAELGSSPTASVARAAYWDCKQYAPDPWGVADAA